MFTMSWWNNSDSQRVGFGWIVMGISELFSREGVSIHLSALDPSDVVLDVTGIVLEAAFESDGVAVAAAQVPQRLNEDRHRFFATANENRRKSCKNKQTNKQETIDNRVVNLEQSSARWPSARNREIF